jgi:hypothetical protein
MHRISVLLLAVLFLQCGQGASQPVGAVSEWAGKYLHGGYGPGLEVHLELFEDQTFKCSGVVHHGKTLFVEGVWVESEEWIQLSASEVPAEYQSFLKNLKKYCINEERVLLPGGNDSVFEGRGKIYGGAFWEGDEPREFEADIEGSWAMSYGVLEDA